MCIWRIFQFWLVHIWRTWGHTILPGYFLQLSIVFILILSIICHQVWYCFPISSYKKGLIFFYVMYFWLYNLNLKSVFFFAVELINTFFFVCFGKVSIIMCIFYLFISFSFRISYSRVFRCRFGSKSTIGFRRSHVVFELWRFRITRKIFLFVKNI